MSINKVSLSLVLVGFITGCGGSGSSDEFLSETPAPNTNIVAISGVYNSSRVNDESYLYISTSGAVIAYDYQGDVSGTGENCYKVATAANQINSGLNSGVVTYSSSTQKYTLTGSSNVLVFNYDSTNGMRNFVLDSVLSGPTGLDISASNMNVKVGGAGSLKSTLLSSDIEAALCN